MVYKEPGRGVVRRYYRPVEFKKRSELVVERTLEACEFKLKPHKDICSYCKNNLVCKLSLG